MKDISCSVLVIGAGPGGYVAAIRAGQLGLDTVIVESKKLGGTCLNIGCIPSKALIHAADEFHRVTAMANGGGTPGISVQSPALDLAETVEWKDGIVTRLNTGVAGLLKKAKVKIVEGWAHVLDGKTVKVATSTGEQIIHAEHIILATGSVPQELPGLPFGGKVLTSADALSLTAPPKRLAVVGAGYIGLELGIAYRKLGSEVTVVEADTRILPQYDPDLTAPVAERLTELGITQHLGAKAKGLTGKDKGLQIETADGKDKKIKADSVLVTVGRKPLTEGWGLEELALDMDGPYIRIDERCRTSMRGVYAIGDVTGEPLLAHRAIAQGEMVAELIADERRAWDKVAIPAVCFTDPEIVTVGQSPEAARAEGTEIVTASFPFEANGRAMSVEAEAGFVRVVARADNHLVLGIQAVGGGVSELSAAFSHALEMASRLEDIADTVHAHPTMSESLQEAALRTLGHAIHI